MADHVRFRAPVACGWLFRLMSLIVRGEERASWFAGRKAGLDSLWVLAERGELAGEVSGCLAWLYRDALAKACESRCSGLNPRRWVRGPAFVMAAAAAAVLCLGAGTHGFAATRSLLCAFRDTANPANQNRLMANLFPTVFALGSALIVAIGRISLRGRNWRYVAFFLSKTFSVVTMVVLLWVEGGAAFRSSIPNPTLRALAGGLLLAAVFAGAASWAMLWSIADQNHRCSVCLRRLIAPVRIGSWASVFEPATVEWLCEDGHGALCEQELETGNPNRWIALEPVVASTSSANR